LLERWIGRHPALRGAPHAHGKTALPNDQGRAPAGS
jgi:hypothetical protein